MPRLPLLYARAFAELAELKKRRARAFMGILGAEKKAQDLEDERAWGILGIFGAPQKASSPRRKLQVLAPWMQGW
jgi:hypothetical protein